MNSSSAHRFSPLHNALMRARVLSCGGCRVFRRAPVTHQDQGVGRHRIDGRPAPGSLSPRKPLVPDRVQLKGLLEKGRQERGLLSSQRQSRCFLQCIASHLLARGRGASVIPCFLAVAIIRPCQHCTIRRLQERLCQSCGRRRPNQEDRGSKPDTFPGSPPPATYAIRRKRVAHQMPYRP